MRPWIVLAVAAALAWGGLTTLGGGPHVRTVFVPSEWDDIPLTCRTTVLDLGGADLETFRCRSRSGVRPPPGRYVNGSTTWYSDVTRRPARRHDITITTGGLVAGWAAY